MESIQNITSGVYTLLQGGVGRLTQNELDFNDVLEVGTDVMRGFIQDGNLAQREHRSMVVEAELERDTLGIDYIVRVATVPDFEPSGLQYRLNAGVLSGWGEVKIVDFDAFPNFYNASQVYAAFYGSTATPEGQKVRLNLACGDVSGHCWLLTIRLPLFTQLQLGDRPPLPVNFMRMVKLAWAIACMPLVKLTNQRRDMWREWKRETLPQYVAELQTWNNPMDALHPGKWQVYLDGGQGSSCEAIPRYDDFRRDQPGTGSMNGVLGPGGMWAWRGNN